MRRKFAYLVGSLVLLSFALAAPRPSFAACFCPRVPSSTGTIVGVGASCDYAEADIWAQAPNYEGCDFGFCRPETFVLEDSCHFNTVVNQYQESAHILFYCPYGTCS